jgi:transcriptional regulator with XRE-family HTH domain
MYLAERLRQLREAKELSQGDVEKRTGLLRCYISRVENGHTVPALETLEKICRALELPMYQLFYEGTDSPDTVAHPDKGKEDWASHGKGKLLFTKFRLALSKASARDRKLLLHMASQMCNGKRSSNR